MGRKLINKEQRGKAFLPFVLKITRLKMIIGFTHKTKKILPRIFCRKFRHCAVILKYNNNYLMLQFISKNKIHLILLKKRDIMILKRNEWVFTNIFINCSSAINYISSFTCVSFAKRILGIHAPFIWTPYQLYKYI